MEYKIINMSVDEFNERSKIKLTEDNLRYNNFIGKMGNPIKEGREYMHRKNGVVIVTEPEKLIEKFEQIYTEVRTVKIYEKQRGSGSINLTRSIRRDLSLEGYKKGELVKIEVSRLEGER